MDLIHATADALVSVLKVYSMDLEDGEDFDFTLKAPMEFVREVDGSVIEPGDYLFHPWTSYGGVVDDVTLDEQSSPPTVTYSGRTWRGILFRSIIAPPSGQSHLVVSGAVEKVIADVIERQGLGGVFVASGDSGAVVNSYRFARYVDAHTGLQAMLASAGMRLSVSRNLGKCELSAVPITDVSRGVDGNLLTAKVTSERPVNHLVCLGGDEMENRTVVNLFMDGSGNVSQTRTFSGVEEIAEIYDFNTADRSQLIKSGTERLAGYYEDSMAVDVRAEDLFGADLGDTVTGTSVNYPISVSAQVSSVQVSVENGLKTDVSYKVGSTKIKW